METEVKALSDRFKVPFPIDIGDGPFVGVPSLPGSLVAAEANATSQEVVGGNSIFADNPIYGRSRELGQGIIRVSDEIPPSSFRRVYRSFRINRDHPQDKNKLVAVRFQGNSFAIIDEEIGYLAPTPATVVLETRRPLKHPRPAPPNTRIGDRLDTLDRLHNTASSFLTPTQSTRLSSTNIVFRYPEYEPWDFADRLQCLPKEIEFLPNMTEEFNMGNSSSELKQILIAYPVGRNMPVIFDIINGNKFQSQVVELTVTVLLVGG